VWATGPAAVAGAGVVWDRVRFVAELARWEGDEGFAFAERPRRSEVVSAVDPAPGDLGKAWLASTPLRPGAGCPATQCLVRLPSPRRCPGRRVAQRSVSPLRHAYQPTKVLFRRPVRRGRSVR